MFKKFGKKATIKILNSRQRNNYYLAFLYDGYIYYDSFQAREKEVNGKPFPIKLDHVNHLFTQEPLVHLTCLGEEIFSFETDDLFEIFAAKGDLRTLMLAIEDVKKLNKLISKL